MHSWKEGRRRQAVWEAGREHVCVLCVALLCRADAACTVPLPKDGPIHDVQVRVLGMRGRGRVLADVPSLCCNALRSAPTGGLPISCPTSGRRLNGSVPRSQACRAQDPAPLMGRARPTRPATCLTGYPHPSTLSPGQFSLPRRQVGAHAWHHEHASNRPLPALWVPTRCGFCVVSQWSPSGEHFVVIAGFIPAKVGGCWTV
jgi:hypothetical protein